MAILDISKLQMYEFHYDVGCIRQKLRRTDDLYKDMKDSLDYYDTSDYPVGHPLQNDKTAKKNSSSTEPDRGPH